MLLPTLRFQALLAAICLVASVAQDPETNAWTQALSAKQKAANEQAAGAFETFAKNFPESPKLNEAWVEAGVCWFSVGRARQKLQRNNEASLAAFNTALTFFEKVTSGHPDAPVAGRAQYMRGSTRMFMGDLPGAEAQFGTALEKYKSDAKYAPKSLERRAMVRRHRLNTSDAVADLREYTKQYPKGEDAESVARYLTYTTMFEKPATALQVEAWVQGEPQVLANLKGDIVALYFFSSWCENCEKVRPFILDFHERYEPLGVHLIGIVDHSKGQTVDSVKAFLAKSQIRFPVVMDSGKNSQAYLGSKIPDMVLIDRAGRVRWHDNPQNLLEATMEAILLDDSSDAPHK